MPARRVWSFDVSRPGSVAEHARADRAVVALLERAGWHFDMAEEREQMLAELGMIVFSHGTEAQLADYLRATERECDTPYRRSSEEYAELAAEIRRIFAKPPGESAQAAG